MRGQVSIIKEITWILRSNGIVGTSPRHKMERSLRSPSTVTHSSSSAFLLNCFAVVETESLRGRLLLLVDFPSKKLLQLLTQSARNKPFSSCLYLSRVVQN